MFNRKKNWPAKRRADILWNSGSSNHLDILRKVSRPDLSLLHGLGFLNKSERVPCDRQRTLWAKMAWGIEYLFNSALILCASSFVLISSSSSPEVADDSDRDEEVTQFLFELLLPLFACLALVVLFSLLLLLWLLRLLLWMELAVVTTVTGVETMAAAKLLTGVWTMVTVWARGTMLGVTACKTVTWLECWWWWWDEIWAGGAELMETTFVSLEGDEVTKTDCVCAMMCPLEIWLDWPLEVGGEGGSWAGEGVVGNPFKDVWSREVGEWRFTEEGLWGEPKFPDWTVRLEYSYPFVGDIDLSGEFIPLWNGDDRFPWITCPWLAICPFEVITRVGCCWLTWCPGGRFPMDTLTANCTPWLFIPAAAIAEPSLSYCWW